MKKSLEEYQKLFGRRYSILYLYLLHKPTWAYEIAKDFRALSERKIKNLKIKGFTEGSKISKILKTMEKQRLIRVKSKGQGLIPRNVTYDISPWVFTGLREEEYLSRWSGKEKERLAHQVEEDKRYYLSTIRKLTPSSLSWLKGILAFEKFNYATILIYWRFLIELMQNEFYPPPERGVERTRHIRVKTPVEQNFLDFGKKENLSREEAARLRDFSTFHLETLNRLIIQEIYIERKLLL
jgi:DNA-binding PadR family transcriptional regulator